MWLSVRSWSSAKWLNVSSWFLAWRLPSICPKLCCKEIQVSTKIRVLPYGTLTQTLDLENFLIFISHEPSRVSSPISCLAPCHWWLLMLLYHNTSVEHSLSIILYIQLFTRSTRWWASDSHGQWSVRCRFYLAVVQVTAGFSVSCWKYRIRDVTLL